MQPDSEKPVKLVYEAAGRRHARDVTLLPRLLGGAFCIVFAAWAWDIWRVTSRGRFYIADLVQPSFLLSVAGSLFCLLVAFGVIRVRSA